MYQLELTQNLTSHIFFLAKMEKAGLINGVITQNVDGLHLTAGNINVHELHGSIRTCLSRMRTIFPMDDIINRVNEEKIHPYVKQ